MSEPVHGPRQSRQLVFYLTLLGLQIATTPIRAEPESSPPEMLEDAELADVFFLDVDRGWAVGDRGVILMTDDGGRRWRQADCPVNCRLESIFFIDEKRGWAVGGWSHPYSHKSSGVVLRTENGGRRWTRAPATTLPMLKQVHFFDHRSGWAIGNSSAMYPAAVFHSQDGGRSWTVVAQGSAIGWVSGHVLSRRQSVVLARNAALAVVMDKQQTPATISSAGLRRTHDLCIAPQGKGWIVGDGGLVLVSEDRGQSWLPCSTLPAVSRQFDFRSIAQSGPDIWIAGAPGSVIFHSADNGLRWEMLPTGEPTSIHRVFFLDSQRGWAVGALGTILTTRDSGETWLRQRGRQRVALLGMFSEASKIPLELLTRLSGDEGYISVVELVARRDVESVAVSESSWEDRAHEAVVIAGGAGASTAWQFPVRQAGLHLPADAIIEGWDLVHNQAEGLERLQEHLVKKIRQWRPDVVVTEPPSPGGANPLAHLINQVTLSATQLASQPTAYPEQLTQLGLEPWGPKKLLAVAQNQQPGTLTIQTSRLATRLGRSLADYASYSRGLIQAHWEPPPSSLGFRLLIAQLPRELAERDFFSGIGQTPGQDARRSLGQAAGDLRSLSRSAQKQRNIRQLLARSGDQQQDGRAWLAQVDDLTRGLNPAPAAHILYQLAQSYRAAGRYNLAAETLLLLVRRHADHPMTEPALLWLVKFANSSEVKLGLLQRVPGDEVLAGVASVATAVVPAGYTTLAGPSQANGDDRPQRSTQAGPESSQPETTDRTIQLGEFIQHTRPPLYADPAIRFAVAGAHRKNGSNRETPQLWRQLAVSGLADAWARSARGELWLADRRGRCPKPNLICRPVDEKPHLDGQLAEPFWDTCEPAILASALQEDHQWPATVRVACDAEYLYLGIHCRKARQAEYPVSDRIRSRDADLQSQDRVDVLIDVDRDCATFFRLTVDHRGWTGEACFGDTRWNPDWFVAAHSNDETWTAEAAIARQELAPQTSLDQTWAIGIQRTVPGVGFQSWTRPAAVNVRPEGFGYLVFQASQPD